MRHEAENLRRVGRDEMNLAEFPIASLAERIPPGCKTMAFEDQHGRLTVIGSDAYGLPTALDSDVIVGLLHLTKQRNDFTDPAVEFSRYELLELLGWTDQGWSYRRLTESLHRWVTVTLKYDGSWWDHKQKRRTSASFHILDRLVVPDEDNSRIVSSFTWGKDFFDSCRDGNLKRLDLTTYFTLKSSLSKQLYRFLDKRFHVRREWDLDLRELAHERIGMSRKYAPWKVKQVLQPILEELEEISFLESLPAADRYIKVGRGDWKIRLVRKLPPSAEPPLLALVEPTGLEKELVERGVTPSVATALVRDVPEERIQRQLEVLDWLRERRPKKVKDGGAYLTNAIRQDFAPPAGFRSRAERAAAEAATRAEQAQQEQTRRVKVREQDVAARLQAYQAALTPAERERLDAEALEQADPTDRATYETATPQVRRLLQVGLRDALIHRRLGLPPAD